MKNYLFGQQDNVFTLLQQHHKKFNMSRDCYVTSYVIKHLVHSQMFDFHLFAYIWFIFQTKYIEYNESGIR